MRTHSLCLSLTHTHTHSHTHEHACTHSCSYIPMYTPTLVYPHTHHTHVYPCTHMHYTLTYTHAHTCMHTHIYTNAHTSHIYVPISHTRTQTHAYLQKEPIFLLSSRALGPAGHRGTCSVSPLCQDEVGAPALRELGSGWGNTACLKDSGQWRGELCLAVIQPQCPSPPFSSWGGKGGDRPSMKGKTPTANNSSRWLVAFC